MAWIRLDTDLEQDRRFLKLDGFGRALWPLLLRLCKKKEGLISADDWDGNYFADLMRFETFTKEIETAMEKIIDVGLMVHEGDRVVIPNWKNYQNPSAQRMAQKRAAKKHNDSTKQVTNMRHSAVQDSTVHTIQEERVLTIDEEENDKQGDIEVQVEIDKTSKSNTYRADELDLAFGHLGEKTGPLARRICELWSDYSTADALGTIEKALRYINADSDVDWLQVIEEAHEKWGPGDPLYWGGRNKLHSHLMSFFKNGKVFQSKKAEQKKKPNLTVDNWGRPITRPNAEMYKEAESTPRVVNLDPVDISKITRDYKKLIGGVD